MDIVSMLLIALALAMDAFAVSVTNGIMLRHFKFSPALKTAIFFGFFQFLMPMLGWFAGTKVSFYIEQIAHWVAFGLLGFIGIRMIVESVNKKSGEPSDIADPFCTKVLFVMAVATSIDALAVGVSLAITGCDIFLASVIIGAVAFTLSFLGVLAGKKLGKLFKRHAGIAGGVILIAIGIKIVLEHLL
ncbi:MAG: putative manganese efflux pump MntP [Firmicutes bacterium ADurb.Bin182]|nr:MAG: putative manganese efflux pump MntP [Firmicutes bacterium ADurb.Bin182]